MYLSFFFFNDTAPTEIYTLSLHDALPIFPLMFGRKPCVRWPPASRDMPRDRKSTRLNSSHVRISYAVFCLKKKKDDQVRREVEFLYKIAGAGTCGLASLRAGSPISIIVPL